MNIEKRYWKWDEALNSSMYKLGNDIQYFVEKRLVIPIDGKPNEYNAIEGNPSCIRVLNNKIKTIFFSDPFFPLDNIWDLPLKEFEKKMDKINHQVNEDFKGNKICVIFRDQFVTLVAIIGNDSVVATLGPEKTQRI